MADQYIDVDLWLANLPILFVDGYPTSLEKFTEPQLEHFIPFMVKCSMGCKDYQGKMLRIEPIWWPDEFPFLNIFKKPQTFTGNWVEKMKEIIRTCYRFHQSTLLEFSDELAAYAKDSLRFIDNRDTTITLLERRSKNLLAIFQKVSLLYDQPQRSTFCLIRKRSKDDIVEEIVVAAPPFDIYLCHNCDAELYSAGAMREHEEICIADEEFRKEYFQYLNLAKRHETSKNNEVPSTSDNNTLVKKTEKREFMIIDSNRPATRNRRECALARCPTIPISSPAGQLLIDNSKSKVTEDYLSKRLARTESFCQAPVVSASANYPKYFNKCQTLKKVKCTYKKPEDENSHNYIFPPRQFSQIRRRLSENLVSRNFALLKKCRHLYVNVKQLTENDIKNMLCPKAGASSKNDSSSSSSFPSAESIVDTIDLYTSDEDDIPSCSTAKSTANASSAPVQRILATIDLCSSSDDE